MTLLFWLIGIPLALIASLLLIVVLEAERQASRDWRNWQ